MLILKLTVDILTEKKTNLAIKKKKKRKEIFNAHFHRNGKVFSHLNQILPS